MTEEMFFTERCRILEARIDAMKKEREKLCSFVEMIAKPGCGCMPICRCGASLETASEEVLRIMVEAQRADARELLKEVGK